MWILVYRRQRFLAHFLRQLATATHMGAPLHQAVRVLARDVPVYHYRAVLSRVADNLERGATLSEAIASEWVFPEHIRRMIAAGERGNALPEILDQVANHMRASLDMRLHLQRFWFYPGVVMVLMLVVLTTYSIFVLPRMRDIYVELLPPGKSMGHTGVPILDWIPTMISLSQKTALAIGVLFLLWLVIEISIKMVGLSMGWLHNIRLHLPGFARLQRAVDASRLLHMLSILLAHRVPLTESLQLAGEASGSPAMAYQMRKAAAGVAEGRPLSECLPGKMLPPSLQWMLSSAEHTHDLGPSVQEVAEYYDEQVQSALGFLQDVVNPLVVVVLGIFVAVAVVGAYLPIFALPRMLLLQ